jgi:hypothetical protein
MTKQIGWTQEIVNAFETLDGIVSLTTLYAYIQKTSSRTLTKQWKATVRRDIEDHSSDSRNYKRRQDLFFHAGHGKWGLRAWQDKIELSNTVKNQQSEHDKSGFFDFENQADGRKRTIASIVRRRGQAAFRRKLLLAYSGKCAITGTSATPALEAAHILFYNGPETNSINNGILLRADIHTLFDLRLITIDPDTFTVLVSTELANSYYKQFDGKPLRLPEGSADLPNRSALEKHRRDSGIL